jgi:hypothetical protein
MLADSMKRLRLHLGKLVHETIINLALLQQALLAIPSPGKLITQLIPLVGSTFNVCSIYIMFS